MNMRQCSIQKETVEMGPRRWAKAWEKKKMMATSVPPTQFGLKGPGGRPLAETTRWPHDLSVISEPLDTISGRRLLEDLAAWRLALIAVWYLSFLINLWPLCRWRRKKRIIEWSRFPPHSHVCRLSVGLPSTPNYSNYKNWKFSFNQNTQPPRPKLRPLLRVRSLN